MEVFPSSSLWIRSPTGSPSLDQHTLFLSAFLLLSFTPYLLVSGLGYQHVPINSQNFMFTHQHYNASVPEDAMARTFVEYDERIGIELIDPTVSVKFRVIQGDDNKLFRCESHLVGHFMFLRLRVRTNKQSSVNRERQSSYNLHIKAIASYPDGPSVTTYTIIHVLVQDSNDMSPIFEPDMYRVSVQENTPINSEIVRVSATDADVGINGDIYYYLERRTDQFSVHPTTGVISLSRPLRHADEDFYELSVLARDRGPRVRSGSRVSTAQVRVTIVAVNYHAPDITLRELPALMEHGNIGTNYAILYVNDKDHGRNGQISNVEIVEGNHDQNFLLVPSESHNNEYNIQVHRDLDLEVNPSGFNLTIQAHDAGTPPRSTNKTVYVTLADRNDHSPQFNRDGYTAEVNECTPPETPILFISAYDIDEGRNGQITYIIDEGNSQGWFVLDAATGLLSIATQHLDAETKQSVVLVVAAEDQANIGTRHRTTTTVTLSITDCNDNAPQFDSINTAIIVTENQLIGTEISRVVAHDADSGDNGRVTYSIANIDDVPFAIDHMTGVIVTTRQLDYEAMQRLYRLQIRASDRGTPYRRENQTLVLVKVRDVNDNEPRFESVNCMGYVARDATVGIELGVLSAIDFDGGNNIISYRILSGNTHHCFELTASTGVLQLHCDLDTLDHAVESWSLAITATDGQHDAVPITLNMTLVNSDPNRQLSNSFGKVNCQRSSATAELSRQLEQQSIHSAEAQQELDGPSDRFVNNQNNPAFAQDIVTHLEIPENLPIGHEILMLSADDPDAGYNGLLTYVITSGNQHGKFKVDTYTGSLFVLSVLDREAVDSYVLDITVADMGTPPRSSVISIEVVLLDVNDNAPVFEKEIYHIPIHENRTPNTTVIQVHATDLDTGDNAVVRYRLAIDSLWFKIDPETGLISVTSEYLDREAYANHTLHVEASDQGSPVRSSVAIVFVELRDVNDNAPAFVPASGYKVRVREDLPVGTVIATVGAYDPDLAEAGVVRYSLLHGADGMFSIDRQTGAVRIAVPLDYEVQQTYNMTLKARDRGEPSLNSRCSLVVEVQDVDENRYTPRFSDFVFRGNVSENIPPGAQVLQLSARDYDATNEFALPQDYQLSYSITGGSGLGLFKVTREGMISTSRVLDRETMSEYWLTASVRDGGAVPRVSYTDVYIRVTDTNDNVPQTHSPMYEPSVPENSPAGVSVQKLTAYDGDEGLGSRVSYAITAGDPQGFFQVDEHTGLITTTDRTLDRETQFEHDLEVTISDGGDPVLSSVTRVIISISDENDNAPVFSERLYNVRVPECAAGKRDPAGTESPTVSDRFIPLYRVLAHDEDDGPNGDIDYSIKDDVKGHSKFKIHPKSGIISAQKELDAGTQYEITVRAVDNGRPEQQRASARVRFEAVACPTESANAPRFLDEPESKQYPVESDRFGHIVTLLTAVDDDGDKLYYAITEGNIDDTFSIDTENGNIVVVGKLDYERTPRYNLTISATDTIHTTYTSISIPISDSNDNRPVFLRDVFRAEVAEDAPVGTPVVTVAARDHDTDKRLFYTIHSTTDVATRDLFKITSEQSGTIVTSGLLDHESISRHELTVIVRDMGTPSSKRSLARVRITVVDRNDHAPYFLYFTPPPPIGGSSGSVGHVGYHVKVYDTIAVGTAVTTINADDRDRGKNAKITYAIETGNIGSVFSMDPNLGIISLAQPLDIAILQRYDLTVSATDRGVPPLSNTTEVTIEVTISDNAAPRFEYTEYTTEMLENTPSGIYMLAVTATSKSSVVYAITDGNQRGFFTVDPHSGVLVANVVFDYELNQFFNLTITATNIVNGQSTATVLIYVIDENDNRPTFGKELYRGNVSEAVESGSVILEASASAPLVVGATDADSDLNALLVYTLVEEDARQSFTIDANTGAIRTNGRLDRETLDVHQFTVQVTDLGTPRLSAEVAASVMIYIDDVNDSPPTFDSASYTADVVLPTYQDVVVITLHADDPDLDNEIAYSFVNPDSAEHFSIGATSGIIRVANVIGLSDDHELVVRASDGVHTTDVQVHVRTRVLSTNALHLEDTLHFSRESYHAHIAENSTTGVRDLLLLQAVGQDLAEPLHYRILNPCGMFEVGETSGLIHTTGKPFDRELQENYTIVVSVTDERDPTREAHTLVIVRILDSNDNVPMFVSLPYHAVVFVDAAIGELVKQVTAIDHDMQHNGEVHYTLLDNANGRFTIDETSGAISVATALSVTDQNREFVLVVQGMDAGEIPQSSEASVSVRVMNEATPVFDQRIRTVTIPENLVIHSVVTTIEADSPTGQKIIYSIFDGDVYGEFAVDFITDMDILGPCSITTLDALDYETRSSYQLTIRATDTKTSAYSDTVVEILLQDINDEKPSFSSLRYTTTVSEAAPLGSSVLTVSATDADSGNNSVINYHIEDYNHYTNDSAYFYIDSERGLILIKHALDHERRAEMVFYAVATDAGVPKLSSRVRVRVLILDLNDNAPEFTQPYYNVAISDQAQRGQIVTTVQAYDADETSSTSLAYSLVGGASGVFTVESRTGIVSLSSKRTPRLRHESYVLNISVTDGVFTAFSRIIVSVTHSNDHVPTFAHVVYDVDVSENQDAGALVTHLSAVDDDPGVLGEITYYLQGDDARETFNINQSTGELTTRITFDREQQSLYNIPVAAVDGGGYTGYALIRVNVADIGDNTPKFRVHSYKANVYADAQIDNYVLQVSAVDADLGPSGELEYSILQDEGLMPARDYLKIDSATGIIRVKHVLQHTMNQLFQFFVRASDRGSPPTFNDVPVDVYVMDPEAEPPQFQEQMYTYFISEDKPPSTVTATVQATSNASLQYSIVPGESAKHNSLDTFTIDSNSGEITMTQSLDRELVDVYELMVRAETQATPALVAYTQVSVQVMDVNDNAPLFEAHVYNVRIPEDAEIGAQVIQVVAHDLDTSFNGEITYSFAEEYRSMANEFSIDPNTGWVTTLITLDRESVNNYTFHIVATDHGEISLTDITVVTLTIDDRNDCAPVFSQSMYEATVNEDALPGTVVLSVTTTDDDIGDNARISYYITSGDHLGQFQINPAGGVYVYKPLDREDIAVYNLAVTASDGMFVSTSQLDVTILDANDNAPECEQPMYTAIIEEVVNVGSYVLRVGATDRDEKGTRNSRVSYTLSGRGTEMFTIHKKSGIISVRRQLDREKIPEYHLRVTASDGPGLSCEMDIYITLTDVNDYSPTFQRDIYHVSVPEDAGVNTLLTRVTAEDYDLGINRKILYAMSGTDGLFAIETVSGIITLRKSLDRETQDTYNITVYAQDQGSPKRMSTGLVIVTVLDVNDSPPVFQNTTYVYSVSESALVSQSVAQVFATSQDTGMNAVMSYAIVGGNEQRLFDINIETGLITIAGALDYETSRSYSLTTQATDHGSPSLSGTAVVRVNLLDSNDNAPEFTERRYVGLVREDRTDGYEIIRVTALDLDTEENAALHYEITDGNDLSLFDINPDDGLITLAGELDREETEFYVIEVSAIDHGEPPLTGTSTVEIVVTDYNDNPPRFTMDNYTALVQRRNLSELFITEHFQEDYSVGAIVLQLQVTDRDVEPNGAPFQFTILLGNTNQTFSIDNDGVLRTAGSFARDTVESYDLIVRVHDGGTPVKYSDTFVHVSVVEESAFAPDVLPLHVAVATFGDVYPGGVFGRVHASDRDTYDVLTYSLAPDTDTFLFGINDTTGDVSALQPLDDGRYDLVVVASDGKYRTPGRVQLQVTSITSQMAHDAVAVRFLALSPEDFVNDLMESFSDMLQREFGVQPEAVMILGIQPVPPASRRGSSSSSESNRIRRATSNTNDLDVLIAIEKSPDVLYKGNAVKRRVSQMVNQLSNELGVGIVQVFNDVCRKDTCQSRGPCKPHVTFMTEEPMSVVATEDQSYVMPKHTVDYVCKCRMGYSGAHCELHDDVCDPNPCSPPHVCYQDSQLSYRCECESGLTGPRCDTEIIDMPNCIDDNCPDTQPLSFSGNSYASWTVTVPTERRMSIRFDIRTTQTTGATLVYAEGLVDYSIVEMLDGMLQYRFDCGSGPGLVRLDSLRIDDGLWHNVLVDRRGNQAEIQLDGKFSAHASAPGTNDVLNLDTNVVFVGSESDGHSGARRGFTGCMKRIMLNGELLPFSGSCSVATFQRFENIEFACPERNSNLVGACINEPCYHGGTCIPTGPDSFMCRCPLRYDGLWCQFDTNPCESSPCLHGGICKSVPNDYQCHCKAGLSGKRCEVGFYCRPNPCKNGARCQDGFTGPVCECNGFRGEFCERDINECSVSPCKNGGQCINTHGSYYCNCSAGTSGKNCADATLSNISSTPFHITMEEIIIIACVLLVLVLFVIILVLIFRCRRQKKRRHRARNANLNPDTKYKAIDCDNIKQSKKVSNVEMIQNNVNRNGSATVARSSSHAGAGATRPHTVSTRPVSMAPSIDSYNTLNNIDCVNNYGSAGDELENAHIELPDFLRNLDSDKKNIPPPPPPPGLHDLTKPTWEANNPNVSKNYQHAHNIKDLKKSPLAKGRESFKVRQMPLQPGSVSSLGSDDEGQATNDRHAKKGYHWDTSDWAADQQPLSNITQVPMKVVPDSPESSGRSAHGRSPADGPHGHAADQQLLDAQTDIPTDAYDDSDHYPSDDNVSDQFVGDSECGDVEYSTDGLLDGPDADYHQLFPDGNMPDEVTSEGALLGYESDYSLPRRRAANGGYNVPHPDRYLPSYTVSDSDLDIESDVPGDSDCGGITLADCMARDDMPEAMYYFGRRGGGQGNPHGTLGGYTSGASVMDDVSVSMGGYASTNVSCSELSGLCEIEDSEANNSDDERQGIRGVGASSLSHTHTDV